MQHHGTIDTDRLNRLSDLVGDHTSTERVFGFIDAQSLAYELHNMDEYTIDIVVRLPDGLTLVYDTT